MPTAIRRLLDSLAARERSLALAWAAGRAVAACTAALLACLAIDWLIDRWGETPSWAHMVIFASQALLWCGAAVFVLRPIFTRHADDDLALLAEEAEPALGHRLITAVQLGREGAKTQGMSPELIAATTRQAEEQSARVDPARVLQGERYRWAAMTAGPALAVMLLMFVAMPRTALALLNRFFLGDAEVPRRVSLTPTAAAVWPANEEGALTFTVEGLVAGESPVGQVDIYPREGPAFSVPLNPDSENGGYVALVPPSDVAFSFRAFLADGRMKRPIEVNYSPRPVVQKIEAWVRLPLWLAKKSGGGDGSPYEEAQKGGDVVWRLPGSRARIRVTSQTRIASCSVRLGKREASLTVLEDGLTAEGEAPLEVEKGVYEVHLVCPHGFANTEPARRSVRKVPLEPPEVVLLPETLYDPKKDKGAPEEHEVEGIPVLEGERFRVDYRATARYGLESPRILYRVVPQSRGDEGQDKLDLSEFKPLPLGPAKGPGTTRSYRTRPAGPDALPDTEAEGTYDFEITGIPGAGGERLKLKKGDRIQYFVEVVSKADGAVGRSAIREKEVVDFQALITWLNRKEDLKERTRALEEAARTSRPGD
jgi:hypothetical protein